MKRLKLSNPARSSRAMSIVLYALGAGLFAWSALLMLGGESYAAMDIAASLAGWGAFTIGLGALVAAVGRLTRVIAAREAPVAAARREPVAADLELDELLPVFVTGEGEPAHFEPASALQEPAEPAVAETPPSRVPEPAPRIRRTEPETRTPEPEVLQTAIRSPFAPKPAEAAVVIRPMEPFPRFRRAPEPVVAAFEPDPQPEPVPVAPEPVTAEAVPAPPATEPVAASEIAAEAPEQEIAPLVEDVADEQKTDEPSRAERRAMRVKARLDRQAEAVEERARPSADEAIEAAAPSQPEPRPIMPRREWEPAPRREQDEPDRAAAPEFAPDDAVSSEPPHADAADVAQPQPPEASAVEPEQPAAAQAPKVPEWLARARERREARMQSDGRASPSARPAPRRPAPAPEPSAAPVDADPVTEETPPAEPSVLREGEHNGVRYRFFADGSVEAASAHGARRFSSIEELRETVIAARGADYDEAPAAEAEPEPPAGPAADPLDAALAELEGHAAPEPRVEPDDRPQRFRR